MVKETLSRREQETLKWILQGKRNRETALIMGVSTKTVESHRASIMAKMGVESFAELIHLCQYQPPQATILARRIADSSAAEIVRQFYVKTGEWLSPTFPEEVPKVAECLAYLTLRGLLERHPLSPQMVRLS